MCMLCRQQPCVDRCPNCETEKEIMRCAGCGSGIYEREEYIVLHARTFHVECVSELDVVDVLKSFGIRGRLAIDGENRWD